MYLIGAPYSILDVICKLKALHYAVMQLICLEHTYFMQLGALTA